MKHFRQRLAGANPDAGNDRRWLYVPYDQLSDNIGPLAGEPPEELGIVMVESVAKAVRRPYHRQKLALILANSRHFALEQAERGVAVRYVAGEEPYAEALAAAAAELGPLRMMEAAERELREELAPLVEEGAIEMIEHGGWLTTAEQFEEGAGDEPPWRMDAFYRRVRRDSGLLMDDDSPEGGKFSHDADNRKPWKGEPEPPEPPTFEPDDVTREVGELIEERFSRHPGRLDLDALPATRDDAERLWKWARENCMEHFGPYEDAMTTRSKGLFHTRVSPLLNLHRLLPADLVREVAELDAPLASREGFVRQILGWREFMRHVHRATDGFRALPQSQKEGGDVETAAAPGDGGWERWRGESWASDGEASVPGGALPSALDADWPLPAAFWGAASGLACLDRVVDDVWHDAYTHHIPRLMVLANLGTLLGVDPRELTDWFWVAFADAYDWVVEPNVLGMGTFALGELFTTKPYVSGANYINKMSDYCDGCRFDPKSNCPITRLYWSFLERNRETLSDNPRMNLVMGSLKKRSDDDKKRDREVFEATRERLAAGEELSPPE